MGAGAKRSMSLDATASPSPRPRCRGRISTQSRINLQLVAHRYVKVAVLGIEERVAVVSERRKVEAQDVVR
jgi:hypothetical protein